jgi:phosphorylcholine metabolism protein LicD
MKKVISILSLIFLISIGFVGCGSSSSTTSNGKLLAKEDYGKMYTDPTAYKGYEVDFYCEIFGNIQKDNNGTYFQAWGDPDKSERNTFIKSTDSKLNVTTNDIIHVVGIVEGSYTGENAFGAKITAPSIIASKVEKTDYKTAFLPAVKTIDVNKEVNQNGYVINVSKVELAEKETRVYMKVTNNSQKNINFYSFNSKITQGSKQFDEQTNYKTDYPDLQSNIMPGISTEGIIAYQPVDINGDTIKLNFEGNSNDYMLKFDSFVFEISLK